MCMKNIRQMEKKTPLNIIQLSDFKMAICELKYIISSKLHAFSSHNDILQGINTMKEASVIY